MRKFKCLLIVVFAASAAAFVAPKGSMQAKIETSGEKFKSIKVLNDMPADQMGKVMNMMSASLGVNCKFCHASNDGDYEKEGNENKETARKMLRMVFDLNKAQFNGRPEINCYTCHRGISHPQPTFPLGEPKPNEPRPVQPEKRPAGDEIAARYESAIGGRAALAGITSMEIKAVRLEPDSKTTEPETVWIKGGKYRSDLLYGTYVVSELFDGTYASKFGGGQPIELKADERDQIRREAEMFSAVGLKSVFPRLDFRSIERINGREAYYVLGTTAGGLRERLYFDVQTGLLVRRAASTPTILGNFVYQVDYSDYKMFGGVKIPTTLHYSVPHISWTRKITEIKINAAVDDSKFAPPARK